jgi:hypothetical protein
VKKKIMIWLARRLPACDHIIEQLSLAMDRRLGLGDRLRLKLHLMICPFCERYGRQIMLVRTALRKEAAETSGGQPVRYQLSSDARDRIKQALHS